MSSVKTLQGMLATKPLCKLGFSGCEGEAYDFDTHPTGVALGEEEKWRRVWYCGPCAYQAARDA